MAATSDKQMEDELRKALGACALNQSWLFSVAGCLLAIPVGVRRKSMAPLVFFGTTGCMLDIVQGFAACEKERAALEAFLRSRLAAAADGGGAGEGDAAAARLSDGDKRGGGS